MELSYSSMSVREAMFEVKGFEWEGDYRPAAQAAIKEMLEGRMNHWIDERLAELAAEDVADRRNGWFSRTLTTEVGDVVLSVQRTRTTSACKVLKAYARRPAHVDRAILDGFLLGASTRKVGRIMAPYLGEVISPSTVSRIAKQLDGAVRAYHERPLADRYRFLFFDGVVLKHKSGAGAKKRVVLVALGITADGRKEVIDFYMAQGESQAAWEAFLNDLYRRGLTGDILELIVTDGGKGLLAALPLVYSSPARSAVLGAQDPQCSEQGAQNRSESRQDRSAQDQPCKKPTRRPKSDDSLSQAVERRISGSLGMPGKRLRSVAGFLQDQRFIRVGANPYHQRH